MDLLVVPIHFLDTVTIWHCLYQARPGHSNGSQEGMSDDDGKSTIMSSWLVVKTVSCKSKISQIYVPMGGIWVKRVVPGAGAWRLQGALWRGGGRDQGSSPANSQLIMLISFPAKMYFSSQTTRICDLCCFCSVATNAKNVIMAATNCYCNHEKSAEPQFFFQLQLCGSGFHLTSSTSSRSLSSI